MPQPSIAQYAAETAAQYVRLLPPDSPLLESAQRVAQSNARFVYGDRLTALFGTVVSVDAITHSSDGQDHFLHCSLSTDTRFHCHVKVSVTGGRDGQLLFMLSVRELDNLEDIELLMTKSGI